MSATLSRISAGFLTLLGAAAIVFLIARLAPGDPLSHIIDTVSAGGGRLDPVEISRLRAQYHLDDPIPMQFAVWLDRLLHGDLGRSLVSGQSVTDLLRERTGPSVLLGITASLMAIAVGIVWGASASFAPRTLGHVLRNAPMVVVAIPSYSLGIWLAFVFAVTFRILPSSGFQSHLGGGSFPDVASHLILPSVTLAVGPAAIIARIVAASIDELRTADFARTARSLGLVERTVVMRHILPNTLLPVVTYSSLVIAGLITSAVFVEYVFNWPGVGKAIVTAALARDYPVLQGGILIVGPTYIALSTLTDLLYGRIDPRIRSVPTH